MKKFIHSCDNCKKEFKGDDLYRLSMSWQHSRLPTVTKIFDICAECSLKLGFTKQSEEAQVNVETLEDKLYSIVEDMVSDAMQNQ